MNTIKLLVPSHGLDSLVRECLAGVNRSSDIQVFIAGPGESATGGVDAPPIRSKLDFKAIKAYRKIMKEFGIDLTFSPSTAGLATMLIASFGMRIKNIGYRGTQAKVRRSDPTNWLALLNPRVAHIVCETPDIEQYLATLIPPCKLSTACKPFSLGWVDDALANPMPAPAPDAKLRIIYIGMSEGRPHKGLNILIDAMNRLKDKDVALTVIGSADKTDVEAAPPTVTFLGQHDNATSYIPSHNLYVLPSLRDASPRVLREAQACGVPCIVSDIPGARDLIDPGKTGILVPPGDVQALANAIANLAEHPENLAKLAANCRTYIADNFDPAAYINYHIALFSSIYSQFH